MTARPLAISLLALIVAGCGGGSGGSTAPPPIGAPAPAPAPTPSPAPTPTPSPTPTPTPPPAPVSVERAIAPAQTDPAITEALSTHVAINPVPGVTARGRLFVMLPGTGAVANTYREVVRTGPPLGYHGIGLSYPNDEAVTSNCAQSSDPDCAGKIRRETLTGDDVSPLVTVNRANSIVNRLTALLRFLNSNFPNEGWGQFLAGNEPDWSRITVAGHSQGSGHAAFLGKLVLLDRVVMFSGPGDPGPLASGLAQWLAMPGVTPPSRHFGLSHTNDPLFTVPRLTAAWNLLGLESFGPVTNVDGATPPFGGSRRLITSAPPNPNPLGPTASPPHGAPVVDAVTPRDANGQPILRPVWISMAYP